MTLDWNNVIWLARRQMRDNWISYLFSAIYFGFMGMVLAVDEFWTVEFAMPVLMFFLIQPSLSPRYMTFKDDNEVTRHQEFLHSLPIGFDIIITARVIAMMVAGVINALLFFIPFWIIGPNWNSLVAYLAWVTFWMGLALAGSGLALLQEFWMSFKNWVKTNVVMVLAVVLLLFFLIWLLDFRPYTWTVNLANEHPWVLIVVGIVIGPAGLWSGMKLAVRGFREREFAT